MCCQPPRRTDDIEVLFKRNVNLLEKAPAGLETIGITGGEPTLLGDKLITLVRMIRERMPDTIIHILSNGRHFQNARYTLRLAEAGGENLVVGVPLHSDYEKDHDIIARAKGAYKETLNGLYNLSGAGVDIELRVVINRLNCKRLEDMALFIHRNLYFVSWTAFMGMEYTGCAIRNSSTIWAEPCQYAENLSKAVELLDGWGHKADIYNIPLCLLTEKSRRFARKSISDWKVKYDVACGECGKKDECCGLFSTSKRIYQGLHNI